MNSQTLGVLVTIIGVLMSFFLLTNVQQQLFEEGSGAGKLDACRTSVLVRNQASISQLSEDLDKITPLSCSTEDIDGSDLNKEEEIDKITELMGQCWYMFAEGRVEDVFKTKAEETTCHVCYQYLPSDNGIQGQDIVDYTRSTTVNPGKYRGVGGSEYIGGSVDLKQIRGVDRGSQIDLSALKSPKTGDFIRDPAGYIEDGHGINERLSTLLIDYDILGNIIVADKVTEFSRQSSHDFMRRTDLTAEKNKTRGFLLTISIADGEARLDMGEDLRTIVTQRGIPSVLKPLESSNQGNLDSAISQVIQRLQSRLENSQDQVVERGSYFSYLTRGGDTIFTVPDQFQAETPYAIAYVSPSNDQAWDLGSMATFGAFDYYFTSDDRETVPRNFILVEPFTKVADRCKVRS
jgi:hypothetical protein